MKAILLSLLVIVLVGTGAALSGDEKCCKTCEAGYTKFYSIDTTYDRCGEACLKPNWGWIYKIFESGLFKAEGVDCASLGYTEYETTETHGSLWLAVTLDKHKKKNKIY